jgi:hypothetical protein
MSRIDRKWRSIIRLTSPGRQPRANSGHSLRTCRTGQFDPLQSFLFSLERAVKDGKPT